MNLPTSLSCHVQYWAMEQSRTYKCFHINSRNLKNKTKVYLASTNHPLQQASHTPTHRRITYGIMLSSTFQGWWIKMYGQRSGSVHEVYQDKNITEEKHHGISWAGIPACNSKNAVPGLCYQLTDQDSDHNQETLNKVREAAKLGQVMRAEDFSCPHRLGQCLIRMSNRMFWT